MSQSSQLEGLKVTLDNLEYHYGGGGDGEETPHVFVYHITIDNQSKRRVKLLGRKWIISSPKGEKLVVEGDKIVGNEPDLAPGENFSYNSILLSATDASAIGSFHGIDEDGNRIHTRIPRFVMRIPDQTC